MQPVADKLGITVEELAEKILNKDYEKVSACINALAEKYQLDHDAMRLVGCGGGAAALVPYCAKKMDLPFSIPENAEVISSIGVALAMVRDVIERVIPNPTQQDIREVKKEAIDACISSGAAPDSVEIHIEIDNQSGKVTAIATGSTEVKTTDLLKECTEEEARKLAADDLGPKTTDIALTCSTDKFYVYTGQRNNETPLRILDKKGFIKVQCSNAQAVKVKAKDYKAVVEDMWQKLAVFKTEAVIRPDFYVCAGPRVTDYSSVDLQQDELLMDLDINDRDPEEDIIIVGNVNDIG
jgi:N-methylhydantoinase A/oxoprolinase/acetone carboxylase beta subunit